jgi:hypothetical protein
LCVRVCVCVCVGVCLRVSVCRPFCARACVRACLCLRVRAHARLRTNSSLAMPGWAGWPGADAGRCMRATLRLKCGARVCVRVERKRWGGVLLHEPRRRRATKAASVLPAMPTAMPMAKPTAMPMAKPTAVIEAQRRRPAQPIGWQSAKARRLLPEARQHMTRLWVGAQVLKVIERELDGGKGNFVSFGMGEEVLTGWGARVVRNGAGSRSVRLQLRCTGTAARSRNLLLMADLPLQAHTTSASSYVRLRLCACARACSVSERSIAARSSASSVSSSCVRRGLRSSGRWRAPSISACEREIAAAIAAASQSSVRSVGQLRRPAPLVCVPPPASLCDGAGDAASGHGHASGFSSPELTCHAPRPSTWMAGTGPGLAMPCQGNVRRHSEPDQLRNCALVHKPGGSTQAERPQRGLVRVRHELQSVNAVSPHHGVCSAVPVSFQQGAFE